MFTGVRCGLHAFVAMLGVSMRAIVTASLVGLASSTLVTWTSTAEVTASPGHVTKTSGAAAWDAGAVSSQELYYSDQPQSLSFRCGAGTDTLAGLAYTYRQRSPIQPFNSIDFGVKCTNDGYLNVRELGVDKGSGPGNVAWTAETELTIRITGTVVEYLKNDEVYYTSFTGAVKDKFPMQVDTSFYNVGNTLEAVSLNSAYTPMACWDGTGSRNAGEANCLGNGNDGCTVCTYAAGDCISYATDDCTVAAAAGAQACDAWALDTVDRWNNYGCMFMNDWIGSLPTSHARRLACTGSTCAGKNSHCKGKGSTAAACCLGCNMITCPQGKVNQCTKQFTTTKRCTSCQAPTPAPTTAPCVPGTYRDASAYGSGNCEPCAPGTYSTTPDSPVCTRCGNGRFASASAEECTGGDAFVFGAGSFVFVSWSGTRPH